LFELKHALILVACRRGYIGDSLYFNGVCYCALTLFS